MNSLNIANWDRREIYDFFSGISNPFYSITFRQDVTRLREYTKKNEISFYYALVWLCTKAINSIPEFLVSLEDNMLVAFERREPSFTDINPGASHFHIVTMSASSKLDEFCRDALNISRNQKGFIDFEKEMDNLIYFSCAPWIDITSLTNERDFDPNDSVPRIAWGKYVERDGELELGLSLEVNHKYIDGQHIGLFHERLTDLIKNLPNE